MISQGGQAGGGHFRQVTKVQISWCVRGVTRHWTLLKQRERCDTGEVVSSLVGISFKGNRND